MIDIHVHSTSKESRAPTDESIRIYDEFLQKARDQVIKELTGPIFWDVTKIGYLVTQMDHLGQRYNCCFVLNNQKHFFDVDLYAIDGNISDILYEKIYSIISKVIVVKLLSLKEHYELGRYKN